MDAFDSDVLIYASTVAHPLGRRVRRLFEPVDEPDAGTAGVGSVVLLPELLAKPRRNGNRAAEAALDSLLARLELLNCPLVDVNSLSPVLPLFVLPCRILELLEIHSAGWEVGKSRWRLGLRKIGLGRDGNKLSPSRPLGRPQGPFCNGCCETFQVPCRRPVFA